MVGIRRRGYTAKALKDFVKSVGWGSTIEVTVPYSALEYYVREDLNKIATRAMVVLDPLKVVITNYDKDCEEIEIENNPNDENAGSHKALFSKTIYIEKEDFSLNPPPKYNRLVEGGIVRLKGAYIIKCNKVVFDDNGEIVHLECEYLPDTKSGNVFSRLNGQQVSRVRNRNPKNPRTNAQLYQRAIMATVMQAYSAGMSDTQKFRWWRG